MDTLFYKMIETIWIMHVFQVFEPSPVLFIISQTKYNRTLSERVTEIGCLTSHATIFQLYMWRQIDVQADLRRSWIYGRAPNAIDIS